MTQPGSLTVLGEPIDLGSITVDSYVVAGIADRITPWENYYRSAQILGGTTDSYCPRAAHSRPGHPRGRQHREAGGPLHQAPIADEQLTDDFVMSWLDSLTNHSTDDIVSTAKKLQEALAGPGI